MQTLPKSIIKLKKIDIYSLLYLFIYFWLHWIFVATHGLSLVVENKSYSLAVAHGLFVWWLLLWGSQTLGAQVLVVAACGLSSCNLLALACMAFSSCTQVLTAHRSVQATGIVAHGLCCSTACGIFLDHGLNLCPPHWQADPYPLCHQKNPSHFYINAKADSKIQLKLQRA